MAAHHFPINLLDDVGDVEFPAFGSQLRVKDDLQQQITELIRKLVRVAAIDWQDSVLGARVRLRNAGVLPQSAATVGHSVIQICGSVKKRSRILWKSLDIF